MKTLAPHETRYCSYYDNDSTASYEVGGGFSYHNGPEWVFVLGRGLICLRKLGELEFLQ